MKYLYSCFNYFWCYKNSIEGKIFIRSQILSVHCIHWNKHPELKYSDVGQNKYPKLTSESGKVYVSLWLIKKSFFEKNVSEYSDKVVLKGKHQHVWNSCKWINWEHRQTSGKFIQSFHFCLVLFCKRTRSKIFIKWPIDLPVWLQRRKMLPELK